MSDPYCELVVIKSEDCIGCGTCKDTCPYDAIIQMDECMYAVFLEQCAEARIHHACAKPCIDPCPTGAVFIQS